MTWTLVLLLAAAAYSFKVVGLIVIGRRQLPAPLERCLALIPAALIAALIVNGTFADGQDLVIDARAGRCRGRRVRDVASSAGDRRDRDRRRRDRDDPTARLSAATIDGSVGRDRTRRSRARRLRRQILRSTACPPTNPAIGPPTYHGNRRSSSHVNRVRRPRSIGSSVNTPEPVTMPECRTPIERPGSHSVISIRSVNVNGPTLVSHTNLVPTPLVCSPTNRIATASAIQSTWRSIGSSAVPDTIRRRVELDRHA